MMVVLSVELCVLVYFHSCANKYQYNRLMAILYLEEKTSFTPFYVLIMIALNEKYNYCREIINCS